VDKSPEAIVNKPEIETDFITLMFPGLAIVRLLNVVAFSPPMFLPEPFKVTIPVPGLKTPPLFNQLPETISVAPRVNVPVDNVKSPFNVRFVFPA